jgi:hypothetical protein
MLCKWPRVLRSSAFKVVGFSILKILDGDLVIASGRIAETAR